MTPTAKERFCDERITTYVRWGFSEPVVGTASGPCGEPAPYADGKCAEHTKENPHA